MPKQPMTLPRKMVIALVLGGGDRPVRRRARGTVADRGRRLRQAAADDGAAVPDGVADERAGRAQPGPCPRAGVARRRPPGVAVGDRPRRGLRVPADVPCHRECVVLQHHARRGPAAVRPRQPLHPVQPVQLDGQQRGSGRRGVQHRHRRGPDRRGAQGAAAGGARDPQRRDGPRQQLRRRPHAVRTVCHHGGGRGDAPSPSSSPACASTT